MKTLQTTCLLLVLTAAAAVAGPADGWFDLENCAMCKHLTDDAELFENMVWNTHLFSNGMVEITTVPAEYEDRFKALMEKMHAAGMKAMGGEQVTMCGMCASYGALMMAGASMDQLVNGEDHIMVVSSQDPAVVAKIRAHGQTTIDEFAKWMAEEGHEHEHDKSHHHGYDIHH